MPEIAWPTCWKHIRASKKRIAILILTFGQNWFLLFQRCLSGFTSFGPKPFSPKTLAPQTQFIETNQPNDEVVLDFHYCLILIDVIKLLGIWSFGPKPFSPKTLAPQTQFIDTNQQNDEDVVAFRCCLILIGIFKLLEIW